jgi:hypothetical protein
VTIATLTSEDIRPGTWAVAGPDRTPGSWPVVQEAGRGSRAGCTTLEWVGNSSSRSSHPHTARARRDDRDGSDDILQGYSFPMPGLVIGGDYRPVAGGQAGVAKGVRPRMAVGGGISPSRSGGKRKRRPPGYSWRHFTHPQRGGTLKSQSSRLRRVPAAPLERSSSLWPMGASRSVPCWVHPDTTSGSATARADRGHEKARPILRDVNFA